MATRQRLGIAVLGLIFLSGGALADSRFLPLSDSRSGQILPTGQRFLPLARNVAVAAHADVPVRRFARLPSRSARAVTAPPSLPATTAAHHRPLGQAPAESPATGHAHIWPVAAAGGGRVSSPFGWRQDPFTGDDAFHAGLDIAAPTGTPVVATADGEISAIGHHPRLGRYVMLEFADGTQATYGHLHSIAVASGQRVSQGAPLGTVGNTGRSTGPHLDYRIKVGGKTVDPLPLLASAR